jgi:hypothetical protein
MKTLLVQGDAQAQGDLVQGMVDRVVEVIVSPSYSQFFVAGQLVNNGIGQGDAHSQGAGESSQELPALGNDSLLGYGQVGYAEESRPHAASPTLQFLLQGQQL